jgi:hypothetical protein
MQQALVTFALRYRIAPVDAYVLPALFERTAQMVNMPASALVSRATFEPKLGEYLAECARKVAIADREAA